MRRSRREVPIIVAMAVHAHFQTLPQTEDFGTPQRLSRLGWPEALQNEGQISGPIGNGRYGWNVVES